MRPVKAEKAIKVLESLGFRIARQRGSHVIMKHPDGRITVIPVHSGENLGPGLLREIIKEAKISKDEFFRRMERV